MALRRADGFRRYALSIQYHGGSFLGFSYQGQGQEDCILKSKDGTAIADLRGYRSVQSRLQEALDHVFPTDGFLSSSHFQKDNENTSRNWENIQVSSRTDRGVHALKNTFHVDIRIPNNDETSIILQKLRRGLNHQLKRQQTSWDLLRGYENDCDSNGQKKTKKSSLSSYTVFGEYRWKRHSIGDEVRILSAVPAPDWMENPYSDETNGQPPFVDWNARFSATERTYVYRILSSVVASTNDNTGNEDGWGVPFEWDRSWQIRNKEQSLNIRSMQSAAYFLIGTHDFTSFRGARCQRHSPVVTMKSIQVHAQPYYAGCLLGLGGNGREDRGPMYSNEQQLVTITMVGDSFLYRQVRNVVGCLVDVGRGKLQPNQVQDLLHAKDRSLAPGMAPPHGLFLVNVKHGDFRI